MNTTTHDAAPLSTLPFPREDARSIARAFLPRHVLGNRYDYYYTLTKLRTDPLYPGVLQALRPTMLDRFGLGAALEALVAQPRRREVDGALPACTLHLPAQGLEALPADMAVHVYRIVQEGLTNAVRHGEARTVQVEMQVEMQTQMRLDRSIDPQAALVIDIADDGRGPGPDGSVPGHGLLGLHERVQALGGTLALDRPEAGGLRLRVRLPIRPPVATEDRT